MRLPVNRILPMAVLVVLAGCGASLEQDVPALPAVASEQGGPAADYPMVIGEPYVVDGKTYTPADRLNSDEVGYASVSPEGGARISAAHKTLPLPSYAEVTALDSGRTILVRLERRGPLGNDRLIELSSGAAAQLGAEGRGRQAVRVRRVNPPEAERALLRSGHPAPARMDTPKPLLAALTRKLEPGTLATQPDVPNSPAGPTKAADPAQTAHSKQGAASDAAPHPGFPPSQGSSSHAPIRPAVPAVAIDPTRAPARTAMPTAASGHTTARGSLVVQAGAFSSKARADAMAAKIGARVERRSNLWLVRMGPYPSRAQAEAALAKARSVGYGSALIQRAN